ncbi:hypothetical protein ACGC1H_002404 [Rhizoctonia solani]
MTTWTGTTRASPLHRPMRLPDAFAISRSFHARSFDAHTAPLPIPAPVQLEAIAVSFIVPGETVIERLIWDEEAGHKQVESSIARPAWSDINYTTSMDAPDGEGCCLFPSYKRV